MKKILAILLTLVLMFSMIPSAFAVTGYEDYSTDELHAMLDKIRNELSVRDYTAKDMTLIYDKCNVQIYLTGEFIESPLYENCCQIGMIIVNNSDYIIRPNVVHAKMNGWALDCFYGIGVTPNQSQRDSAFTFGYELANISSIEEIENIDITLELINNRDYYVIDGTEETIHLTFNEA